MGVFNQRVPTVAPSPIPRAVAVAPSVGGADELYVPADALRPVICIPMTKTLTVPIFRSEDWARIKACSMDDIPGSYDDYIREMRRRLAKYKKHDQVVVEIEIDFDDMLKFLLENGLANVADHRHLYIESITETK